MKRLIGIAALLLALGLSVAAQIQQMTADDQDRFNGYYSRWVQDKQSNNRDDMLSMEHRMQDLMDKYQIPSSTPYDQVASQAAPPPPPAAYERGYDRDRDRGAYAGGWQGNMSPDDQKEFNKEYQKWQDASAKHDQDDIDKHARKMQEIMARNNVPPDTPFDAVASAGGGYAPRVDYRAYQNKMSPDDQAKYDKAYEKWLKDRQKNDRDDIAKNEGKMQELMARYNIPRDVPYNLLASSAKGYY